MAGLTVRSLLLLMIIGGQSEFMVDSGYVYPETKHTQKCVTTHPMAAKQPYHQRIGHTPANRVVVNSMTRVQMTCPGDEAKGELKGSW
jgi:hypothetical protein